MKRSQEKRFRITKVMVVVSLGVLTVFVLLVVWQLSIISRQARASLGIIGCREILSGIQSYAQANGGYVPEQRETSNRVFDELIRRGYFDGESPFYVFEVENVENPTLGNKLYSSGDFLAPGENVFSYWAAAAGRGRYSNNEIVPLVSIPQLSTGKTETYGNEVYDYKTYAGLAVVGYSDGSAMVFYLDRNGKRDVREEDARMTKELYTASLPDGVKFAE